MPATRARDDRRASGEARPRRARGVLGAFVAAVVLVVVTAVITAVVVDALHGRTNPIAAAATDTRGETQENAVDRARAAGYREGVRDTREQATQQLGARYDQGYAKGYAQGRSDVETSQGSSGGYAEGYNAGVQAAIDAYKEIIAQAQRIIAEAGQAPTVTAPQPTMTN
jgi:hypothetical protein